MIKEYKVVVWDLDESLGHFVQLGIFIDCLEHALNKKINQQEFNELCDLYPEILRTHILHILHYLKDMKIKKTCNKVFIYTNNNGAKEWTYKIKQYLHNKLKYKLFDKAICAYKVNGIQIESNRTTYDKTLRDLIACTKIPEESSICFIDDQYHKDMKAKNISYMHISPYTLIFSIDTMLSRYINKHKIKDIHFYKKMKHLYNKYKYHQKDKSFHQKKKDKAMGIKILNHIKLFLNGSKKTKKKKYIHHNYTRKKI